jgi:hypothetical protein
MPILNEAGTCRALMAASRQASVDRYTAMFEGLLTSEGAKFQARGATPLLAAPEASVSSRKGTPGDLPSPSS